LEVCGPSSCELSSQNLQGLRTETVVTEQMAVVPKVIVRAL